MMFYLTTRMGKSKNNPSIGEIETAIDEALTANDEEHNSISLSNEEGYFLEIYQMRFVILENLQDTSFQLIKSNIVSRETIIELINIFLNGEINQLSQKMKSLI